MADDVGSDGAAPSQNSTSGTQNGPARVLLVDDDRDLLRGLTLRLSSAGYQVQTASDGEEALDRLGQAKPVECVGAQPATLGVQNSASPPDAIVLDIRMPRMDGLTLLGHLRACPQTKAIPVIVISASVDGRTRKLAAELDARFFLQKPCRTKDLLSALVSVTKPSAAAAAQVDDAGPG